MIRVDRPASGLYAPRPVAVRGDARPEAIAGRPVEAVREEWLVEDRWWTSEPLRRHYFELVLEGGRCLVVFRELTTGRWFSHR